MEFFVITAYKLDQLFFEKKVIVERIAARFGMMAHYAQFHFAWPVGAFDMKASHKIIMRAAFLLADLSYERPSCYYEIGLAHGLGKDVALIAYDNRWSEHYPVCAVLGSDEVRYYSDLATYERLVTDIIAARASAERSDAAAAGSEPREPRNEQLDADAVRRLISEDEARMSATPWSLSGSAERVEPTGSADRGDPEPATLQPHRQPSRSNARTRQEHHP